MTPIEIFGEIHRRQIQGIMLHDDIASLYDFMNLHGYKRCHEYHALKEYSASRSISRYAINHLQRMLPDDGNITIQKVTSPNWLSATRLDVSETDRKNYIKKIFERWRSWEMETKTFYCKKFKELTDGGYIACANKVNELIKDIDCELKYIDREYLSLCAVGFDMLYVMQKQDDIHEHYAQKEKEIGVQFN